MVSLEEYDRMKKAYEKGMSMIELDQSYGNGKRRANSQADPLLKTIPMYFDLAEIYRMDNKD